MAKKTILVVDDEVIMVDMIRMRLEANGYEVETANDGLDGLAKAEMTKPDLIILDIGMDKMDGYTMLKEIRGNEPTKEIKVIMLTASGKTKEKFEEQGISDYILKPFDADDLIKRVKSALKKK